MSVALIRNDEWNTYINVDLQSSRDSKPAKGLEELADSKI